MIVFLPRIRFKAMSTELTATSIADWKTYLRWNLINRAASGLSAKFVDEDFHFKGTILSGAQQVPEQQLFDNAFKIQWELFLRHVVLDDPFRWTLLEGAKGVQLAEKGIESWHKRCWIDIPDLQ